MRFGGGPILHRFTTKDNLAAVRLLVEYGADVTGIDASRLSATYLAVCSHCRDEKAASYDICKLLLESGATCNDRTGAQVTPLHRAVEGTSVKMIQLLLDYGADIRAVDENGWTAVHYAVRNHRVDVLQFVLHQGLDIDGGDYEDHSPLYEAALNSCFEVCEFLLKCSAKVNRESSETDESPLSYVISEISGEAQIRRNPDRTEFVESRASIVDLLLEYGARVAHNADGQSILERAAEEDNFQCIRNVLIRHIAKMEYLKSEIDEYDRHTIENNNCYKKYYYRCLQEFEIMKETKFYNKVSIFNIFTESPKVISRYARNEELVIAFQEKGHDDKFPIYFAQLKKRLYTEVEKQKLRNDAADILKNVFKLNDLSHPVIQKILSFLSDGNLKFLESK